MSFSKQNSPINLAETATSHLDFTGVIEEHNEMHHTQRLMELPVRKLFLCNVNSFFGCRLLTVCSWTLT